MWIAFRARSNYIRQLPLAIALLLSLTGLTAVAQGGGHILYGDLKVEEGRAAGLKPLAFDVILYTEGGSLIARQTVANNGRYRFLNLRNGSYDVVVEVENSEVARLRVNVTSPFKNDFRQDILMEWRESAVGKNSGKAATVSVEDLYQRTPANQKRLTKAAEAMDKKSYEQARALLHQLVEDDPKDFQAWTELGTVYYLQKNNAEAEKAYLRALESRPKFVLPLLNLGRIRLSEKNYAGAVEVLSRAVEAQPQSANANYYLGEAHLQNKKGSKAVEYFNEALRLDPAGKAEAHLRLALLYHAAGLKERAAAEYERFLAKEPNHPDKQKMTIYIAENKKK